MKKKTKNDFFQGGFLGTLLRWQQCQCVKCAQIRSFFLSVFCRIRTEYGPEKIPYLDIFHAVCIQHIPNNLREEDCKVLRGCFSDKKYLFQNIRVFGFIK